MKIEWELTAVPDVKPPSRNVYFLHGVQIEKDFFARKYDTSISVQIKRHELLGFRGVENGHDLGLSQ